MSLLSTFGRNCRNIPQEIPIPGSDWSQKVSRSDRKVSHFGPKVTLLGVGNPELSQNQSIIDLEYSGS